MVLKKFMIAGGNSTLLVWDCPSSEKNWIIKKYLTKVEQIGFISSRDGFPLLNMMGKELCINGTIAFAKTLNAKGKLYTSGCYKEISYKNYRNRTLIKITIPYKKQGSVVILSGIGYVLVKKEKVITKDFLSSFCKEYKLPAFGALIYKNNTLFPYVFVRGTRSLIPETSCGSGSISLNILKGITRVNQTTGKQIIVARNGFEFFIEAEVTRQ